MGNWFRNGNVDIVMGLQWGSEGKGSIAGFLARRCGHDLAVSCSGANSGHTWVGNVMDMHGNSAPVRLVHRHLPLAIVSPSIRVVLLGPGAIINPEILANEIRQAEMTLPWFHMVKIYVHPNATVIYQRHIDEEGGTGVGIGSTMKGNGAALREKLLRSIDEPNVAQDCTDSAWPARAQVVSNDEYDAYLKMAKLILFEGAQGFGLSLNSGPYPFVTSRECTPAQMCADALIPPQMVRRVIGVVRTLPIRVANRYDADGKMIGHSGPHWDDQDELTWAELGRPPEFTTVTQLQRRVFSFSVKQLAHAVRLCRPDEIALTFCDYLNAPVGATFIPPGRSMMISTIEKIGVEQESPLVVRYTADGPSESDIFVRTLLDPFELSDQEHANGTLDH